MPRQLAPRQLISYGWLRGEDFWGDPMSDNMVYTDAMLHPAPESMTQPVPPLYPTPGVQYIVPHDAQFEWAGHVNELTMYIQDRWVFFKPIVGVRALVKDYTFVWFDGEQWVAEPGSAVAPSQARNYDVSVSVGYAPVPNETLLVLPVVQPLRLEPGAPLSLATCVTPPTRVANMEMFRNGSLIGVVSFSPTTFAGAFLVPSPVTFGIGDRLTVVTSSGIPDNFGNFGMVLRMALLT